ncbi:ABC transporter ATP-binding protein [Caldisericum exile]|uniref:ABC transporter n=1 Tax=Caldisericum exile (strain DSM 21853 / NBRC 104410 / AZM16c01) TaxID=511051 RepID=A0A7U6GF05_CALEA|nr:ABC transporter ATP-binding protein [Caldisericum exile]BAL81102.1 putative ABC transporter [Caldisericum exile AZM16c01]
MKTLKDYFRKEFFRYVAIVTLLIVVDFAQVYLPQFTKSAIDSISVKNTTNLFKYSIYILVLSFGIVSLRFLYQSLLRKAVLSFDYELKNKIFESFVFFKRKTLEKFEIGDLMSRVTNDTQAVRMFLIMGFLAIIDVFVLGLTTFIFMMRMNLKLTLAVSVPLLFLFPLALNFGTKIHRIYKRINMIFADMSVRVRELVNGIRVIKAFVKEQYFTKLFHNVNQEYLKENMQLVKLDGFFDPIVNFMINAANLVLIFYGGLLYIKGVVGMGTIAAFFQYIETLTWPMMAVGFSIALYQRATASLSRIEEVLNQPKEKSGRLITDIERIHIKDLHFSFDDNVEVLKGISLNISKGEVIGITGAPGSGKTALIHLLLKIVDAKKGSIFYDGIDINSISFESIKRIFSYVPQEGFLFSDTIYNNIKIGNPDATREEIENVAKVACIYDDIMSFKDGFNTVVGEQGITLSGGERQRIAIARALLTKRPYLILDDALASVDFKTESNIIKNLEEYFIKNGLTVIMISERLSSLLIANRIFVLVDGKIIEEGTFNELISKEGYFYHLYRKQLLEANL